jgi:succinate dehydrogenase / fumarate reductase membrane anchor subunit
MSAHRTPLKKVRGLGSARSGVGHWWVQRLTALALIPLALWFVWHAVGLLGADLRLARDFVGAPVNAVLLVLSVITLFWHSFLGVQVVIEDYVHGEARRLVTLVVLKFIHIILAAAGVFAVLSVALGG